MRHGFKTISIACCAAALALGGQAAAQGVRADVGKAQDFLRANMIDGVIVSASNSYFEAKGGVVKVQFASDDIPGKPANLTDPCIMLVELQDRAGRGKIAFAIFFSKLEGIASIGGVQGVVNPPYTTMIYINGQIIGQNVNNQPFPYHSAEFTFQMMTMRDRVARAMKDLQAACTRPDGSGY